MGKPVLSRHINALLHEFASDTFTPLQECDFQLLGYNVYVKYPHDESFSKLDDTLYKKYQQDIRCVLKDKATIYQAYKVHLLDHPQFDIHLDYELQFDALNVAPQLTINTESLASYTNYEPVELLKIIAKEINKIKARNNILIDFHHRSMIQDIKQMVQDLYSQNSVEKSVIRLFDGVAPVLSTSGTTLLHFEDKTDKIVEISKDDLLLEYKKPRIGSNGFNCFGHQIDNEALAGGSFNCEIDTQSIQITQTDDKIILTAKKDGYIKYDGKHIAVSNVVEIDSIKRVESKLTDDEDNKIEVIVSQNDITRDSIGEGVELASERIHINGFVGRNSTLEASELIVDGATHTSSKLFAKHAVINRHKGILRCHEADIKLLEGGTVYATTVHVEAALGGSIYAKNITLGQIKHNLNLYASHSITIKQISGEDNKIIMDYKQVPIVTSELEFIAADLEELQFQLEEAIKSKTQTSQIQKDIQALKERKNELTHSAYTAFVEIKHPVHGLNTITFVLPDNSTMSYKTKDAKYEQFHLVFQDDFVTLAPVGIKKMLSI